MNVEGDERRIWAKVLTAAASPSKIINSQLDHWLRESFGYERFQISRCHCWLIHFIAWCFGIVIYKHNLDVILIPILFGVDDSFFLSIFFKACAPFLALEDLLRWERSEGMWRKSQVRFHGISYLHGLVKLINYQTSEMNDRYGHGIHLGVDRWSCRMVLQHLARMSCMSTGLPSRTNGPNNAKQWEVSSGKRDELFQRFSKVWYPKQKLFANIGFIQ